ncbi:MAG: ABC transporter ATP-binding protein [Trueperaceae bacterium]|nr:ABC transporter ATP-binding protein [Trueperaceae bacterium]
MSARPANAPAASGQVALGAVGPLLELRTVESGYHKQLRVLKGVSLSIMPGTCVAVLGSNGAGKSTMLKTIMGLVEDEPRKGTVWALGKDVTRADTERISQAGIAYVVEDRGMFPDLTVAESLRLGAFHRNDRAAINSDLERMFTYFPRLAERLKQDSGTLSGGEQQMLAIARALMSRPKLLMLDEPSLGLAPMLVEEIFRVIRAINREGMGILLVEQNANQALAIADYGYVLEGGRFVLEGTAAELRGNENVQEFYLGVRTGGDEPRLHVRRRRRRWN